MCGKRALRVCGMTLRAAFARGVHYCLYGIERALLCDVRFWFSVMVLLVLPAQCTVTSEGPRVAMYGTERGCAVLRSVAKCGTGRRCAVLLRAVLLRSERGTERGCAAAECGGGCEHCLLRPAPAEPFW
eukprot:2756372-Rhodomonas_salina.1